MIVGIIVGIMAVTVIAGFVFVNQPSFGRAPQGEALTLPYWRMGSITKIGNISIPCPNIWDKWPGT